MSRQKGAVRGGEIEDAEEQGNDGRRGPRVPRP